jgi:membrane protease YdiL (CAAX protease family)
MKRLRKLFGNGWVILGLGLYLVSLGWLIRQAQFSLEDALTELVIFGLGFSLAAWVSTIPARPLSIAEHPRRGEMFGLLGYLLLLALYLAFGPQATDSWLPANWVSEPRIHFAVGLIRKLIVFVLVPFVLFGTLAGYRWRDFGLQWSGLRELAGSHLPVVLAMSGLILLFQYFLGGGAAPLREGKFSAGQLAIGLPLCFIWLLLETGLVEEFFFRALLQSRLSAWFGSEVTGVTLMALAFGLAHAPGFIFRHAGTVEGLGANPSAADAIAYAITTLAVSGIFLGVVWARTRNLFALIIIHAATDLLPNFSQFVRVWGI